MTYYICHHSTAERYTDGSGYYVDLYDERCMAVIDEAGPFDDYYDAVDAGERAVSIADE